MNGSERPPFDALDAEIAAAFLRGRELTLLDPFEDADKIGDRIFTTTLSSARRFMADSFGIVRADGTPFRAYPFIVARPSANAFAIERHRVQLCGLEIGMVTAAFEISLFVFSRKNLFRGIGDAGAEAAPDLPAGSQLAFWMADELRRGRATDAQPIGIAFLPRDPLRGLAVHLLAQLMLRFVWLHELFHGVNGHTGLLSARRPEAVLNEMPDNALGLIEQESEADMDADQALRRAMEYDADRSALWAQMHLQQIDNEPLVGLQVWPRPLRLRLALFAAVLMTFVFDQAARRQTRSGAVTHPPAQNRLFDLIRIVSSHLLDEADEMQKAFTATLAEMDRLHASLPSFQDSAALLRDLRSAALQRELDESEQALTEARLQFAPFAYRPNVLDQYIIQPISQ